MNCGPGVSRRFYRVGSWFSGLACTMLVMGESIEEFIFCIETNETLI